MSVLSRVNGPDDIRALTPAERIELAADVRTLLVEVVNANGGHLSPNLGVVEMAIALLAAFDTPHEPIIWDVGHQAYAHKILTGRRDRFHTLKQAGGISGFLKREESEHDAFGAGHTSTSISAALGFAVANQFKGNMNRHAVAVIGDGALTGGLAWEALNNAGHMDAPLIVVLNDNELSIARSVGALHLYLNRMRAHPAFEQMKEQIARVMKRLPAGETWLELSKRFKDGIKEVMLAPMIWEELGFTYLGPVDGHDTELMIDTFRIAKTLPSPVFIHVLTTKGKGLEECEADPIKTYSVEAPKPIGASASPPAYRDFFSQTLIEQAARNALIVGITAAMPSGTGMDKFQKVYPDRMFDVGIAEQHAVTFAAGLAAAGMKPVCAIYSTFLQRAYDSVIHDVAIQNLPVTFVLVNAGLVGEDGRTHHGIFDIAYLRAIPNMVVMAPKDENELRHMMATAMAHDGPISLRFPRGAGLGVPLDAVLSPLPIGKAETLRNGADVAILSLGVHVATAVEAADVLADEGIEATVINARFAKPLDEACILDLARRVGRFVTIEEGVAAGGFGSAVLELLAAHGLPCPVTVLGIPDRFVDHGKPAHLRAECGLTAANVAAQARKLCAVTAPVPARSHR
jgi:1-deoxy-D-xylulose-5-phosphate synthase